MGQEKTRETNGNWIERGLMVMMVVAFAVAIGLIVAAVVTGQGNPESPSFTGWAFAIGGSGASWVLSLVMLALQRMRRSRSETELLPEPTPVAPTAVGEAPNEAPA